MQYLDWMSIELYTINRTKYPPSTLQKQFDCDKPERYMLNLTWRNSRGSSITSGEKGEDYRGRDTAPEALMRSALMVAVRPGKSVKPNLYLGVGYEDWHNKFGVDGGRGSRASRRR